MSVYDRLFSLGDSADQVAETLASRGCKGRRGSSIWCPVARFLKHYWPARRWHLYKGWSASSRLGETHEYAVPRPVAEFPELFDRGYYPYLEMK